MRLALVAAVSLIAVAAAEARPITFATEAPRSGSVVVPLASEAELNSRAGSLDRATRESIRRALASAKFDYAQGKTLSLRGLGAYDEIVVVGAKGAEGPAALQDLGGAARVETKDAAGPVAVFASGLDAAQIALGAGLGGYSFAGYKSGEKAPKADAPFVVVTPQAAAARTIFERDGRALADAVAFTRDLITTPSNLKSPEWIVEQTRQAFQGVPNVTVEALGPADFERLGMGGMISVGQGSAKPPRMLIVEYRGAGASTPPVVLTGKGITFDSGSISIKPAAGMWRMKYDMAGAAAAVGTVLSLAKSGAPVNVVAIGALAENMPDGNAARPGDVVRFYNGMTAERLNVDAEGRIVLGDATAYAEARFKPAAIVNLATLTGAVRTALGDDYAGLFATKDGLAAQIETASVATGEGVWRLPMHESLAKEMESPVADMRDVVEGGGAGASIGAQFIRSFVETTPWAHLDIAGMAWVDSAQPTVPKGARGFGVRLLDRFVRDFEPAKAMK